MEAEVFLAHGCGVWLLEECWWYRPASLKLVCPVNMWDWQPRWLPQHRLSVVLLLLPSGLLVIFRGCHCRKKSRLFIQRINNAWRPYYWCSPATTAEHRCEYGAAAVQGQSRLEFWRAPFLPGKCCHTWLFDEIYIWSILLKLRVEEFSFSGVLRSLRSHFSSFLPPLVPRCFPLHQAWLHEVESWTNISPSIDAILWPCHWIMWINQFWVCANDDLQIIELCCRNRIHNELRLFPHFLNIFLMQILKC